jgi:gamma-glutamylcyclotransferase (GGCT)/AIG2-like uncharacterized protein YtfP
MDSYDVWVEEQYFKQLEEKDMSDKVQPNEGKTFIAVYGSLRTGESNFHVNARGNGVFVGKGKTKDNHNLYRYAGCYFPSVSLVHNSHGVPVVVEVFEAPNDRTGLKGSYDSLEGYRENDPVHNFYNRTQIPIVLDDGRELDAWIYHIDEEQSEGVADGDWCKYLAEVKAGRN